MAQLTIDIKKLAHNISFVARSCKDAGLDMMGVLKGPGMDSVIIRTLVENGVETFGFSNMPKKNLYDTVLSRKPVFISLPSIHEIHKLVRYFGTSFNTEISVIQRINEVLIAEKRSHNIILMVDTGDLREGVLPENVVDTVRKIHDIKERKLGFSGIGTNLGCCAGMVPDEENIQILQDLALEIEARLGIAVDTVSVGGSVFLGWLKSHRLPHKINQIRLGEAVFLGNIPTLYQKHEDLYDDVLVFKGDVLETQEKRVDLPRCPGRDALGFQPAFPNTGKRKRAILNFGISDTYPQGLRPLDEGSSIVCINSNYTVMDYTDSPVSLKPGDFVEFKMNYISMLQAFMSPFTDIVYQY
ncbi:MAG: amino-acid racemase [Desulfobacterales bacterium RIFOXYA12_FULL_46_15]|nr:MAG: amino-acid racemase [Desulfobacterales bacterium RIFOXYA12_FULL_46_15]